MNNIEQEKKNKNLFNGKEGYSDTMTVHKNSAEDCTIVNLGGVQIDTRAIRYWMEHYYRTGIPSVTRHKIVMGIRSNQTSEGSRYKNFIYLNSRLSYLAKQEDLLEILERFNAPNKKIDNYPASPTTFDGSQPFTHHELIKQEIYNFRKPETPSKPLIFSELMTPAQRSMLEATDHDLAELLSQSNTEERKELFKLMLDSVEISQGLRLTGTFAHEYRHVLQDIHEGFVEPLKFKKKDVLDSFLFNLPIIMRKLLLPILPNKFNQTVYSIYFIFTELFPYSVSFMFKTLEETNPFIRRLLRPNQADFIGLRRAEEEDAYALDTEVQWRQFGSSDRRYDPTSTRFFTVDRFDFWRPLFTTDEATRSFLDGDFIT